MPESPLHCAGTPFCHLSTLAWSLTRQVALHAILNLQTLTPRTAYNSHKTPKVETTNLNLGLRAPVLIMVNIQQQHDTIEQLQVVHQQQLELCSVQGEQDEDAVWEVNRCFYDLLSECHKNLLLKRNLHSSMLHNKTLQSALDNNVIPHVRFLSEHFPQSKSHFSTTTLLCLFLEDCPIVVREEYYGAMQGQVGAGKDASSRLAEHMPFLTTLEALESNDNISLIFHFICFLLSFKTPEGIKMSEIYNVKTAEHMRDLEDSIYYFLDERGYGAMFWHSIWSIKSVPQQNRYVE